MKTMNVKFTGEVNNVYTPKSINQLGNWVNAFWRLKTVSLQERAETLEIFQAVSYILETFAFCKWEGSFGGVSNGIPLRVNDAPQYG